MISSIMGDGSVRPTCSRRAWGRNRIDAEAADRRVLLMPGTGYTCDRPLLYYSANALIDDGWYADRLDVNANLSTSPASEIIAMLSDAVDDWLREVNADAERAGMAAPRVMLVTKSLSTFMFPHAQTLDLPVALLTPVFAPADFDPSRSVIPVPGDPDYDSAHDGATKPLICAGDADPLFNGERARRLSPHVHEYAGANHSIEVPGDWRTSMTYLRDVVEHVVSYAGGISREAATVALDR
ncbi:hypothetical protein [Bifidobacterium jacchi]|uniref:hypothetical protein n=1 Tax=Bifidobacterium jacchi TaxID=2490545 RepID=UPI001F502039|nr:hypothetical protein [Bifidobacterium jacchi]